MPRGRFIAYYLKYSFLVSSCLCIISYMSYRLGAPVFSVGLWLVSGVVLISGITYFLYQGTNEACHNEGTDRHINQHKAATDAPPPLLLPFSVQPYGNCEKSQLFPGPQGKPLTGMSFSITGRISVKRSNIICLIEHLGGKYHKAPCKDTTYLIIGETGGRITGKMAAARKNNSCAIIDVDDFARLIGVSYSDLKDHFFDIVDRTVISRMKGDKRITKENKNNRKEFKKLNSLLKELIKDKEQINLSSAIQVVIKVDENEMELAEVNRVSYNRSTNDYILYAMDGEAIYLDDLRECSICDLADILSVA